MNFLDLIFVVAGVLQLAVAAYGLRLSRRYGTTGIGWSLFSSFATLAFLHGLFSSHALGALLDHPPFRDLTVALVSVVLLIGFRHLTVLLQRTRQSEQVAEQARAAERLARIEVDQRVREETDKLSRANHELQQTSLRLQAELARQVSQMAQAEKSRKDLLQASRQAGMSEVATAVLHNVGNVLNSVNVSATLVADHVADFRIDNIARAATMVRQHDGDLADFLTNDPKGRQLPEYMVMLASHLRGEQTLILKEIGFVRSKIDHIKQIVATQQSYGKVMGLAESVRLEELVDDVLRIQAVEMIDRNVQVRREYAPLLPTTMVDKHKVLQILLNVLSNAKHACLESGQADKQILVRVTNGDDRLRIAVNDNGVGIPAANLNCIFNHGFTTRKKGGHGFGLHGSALAAKELGGNLAAHSDGPGKGATFTLELPIKPTARSSRS